MFAKESEHLALGLYGAAVATSTWADARSPVSWVLKLTGIGDNSPGLAEGVLGFGLLALWLYIAPKALGRAWSLVLALLALCGALGFVSWWLSPEARASGPFASADELGVLCGFGLVLALARGSWLAAGACVLGLLASESRGGLVVVIASAICWRPIWGILAGIWLAAAAVYLRPDVDTLGLRWDLLHRALVGVAQRPMGWGHEGWMWIETVSTPRGVSYDVNTLAHCLPLDWALVGGLGGVGALGLLTVASLARLWRYDRPLAICCLGLLSGLMTLYETWSIGALLTLVYATGMRRDVDAA